MSQAPELPAELSRSLHDFARALLVAARHWALYPPSHPSVTQALVRLSDALRGHQAGTVFAIGITPTGLFIDNLAADPRLPAIAEAAAFLHDRDLLHLTFVGDVPLDAVQSLLRLLTLDDDTRRRRGGPARIWDTDGHPAILLEQIDYEHVFERTEGDVAEPAKRDDVWRALVSELGASGKALLDQRAQQRLLAIAGSPADIGDLATDIMAPRCAMDGSPMITSQAAAVLAAFRHLTSLVSVMSPDRLPEVMSNLATAAAGLDPHVVMQVLQGQDDPRDSVAVIKPLTAAFDDVKVAQLLATALALDGRASDRLATVFHTIAPDEERKRRVLTLTRTMLGETDFGRSTQFQALWTSAEELLVSYNDRAYVSDTYRASLDGVGERAEAMAGTDLPPELDDWMTTLGQDAVRTLSVTMLLDLMAIEADPLQLAGLADDLGGLAEDMLMAGAYADARRVVDVLAERGSAQGPAREGCRVALDRLGESAGLRDAAAVVGDLPEADWTALRGICERLGPASVDGMRMLVAVEDDTTASTRVADLIVSFGPKAAPRLSPLLGDARWFAQRAGARLLGRIGTAEAVPLLQPLLRGRDPRVAREAVAALGNIDDPSAARAIQTVLRAATGDMRQAVVDALVAERDPRVVPMLARILAESDALGKDHTIVLDAVRALGMVGTEAAVTPLARTAATKRWFGGAKLRALKATAVEALIRVDTPGAHAALDDAATRGDRGLRKAVAAGRATRGGRG